MQETANKAEFQLTDLGPRSQGEGFAQEGRACMPSLFPLKKKKEGTWGAQLGMCSNTGRVGTNSSARGCGRGGHKQSAARPLTLHLFILASCSTRDGAGDWSMKASSCCNLACSTPFVAGPGIHHGRHCRPNSARLWPRVRIATALGPAKSQS